MDLRESCCKLVAELYANAYQNMQVGDIIQQATGVGGEGFGASANETVMNICIDQVCPAVASIGIAIVLLFFIISLVELAISDRMTPELFIKYFSKFVIAAVLVDKSSVLIKACVGFGNALTVSFSGSNADAALTYNDVFNNYFSYFMGLESSWILIVIGALFSILLIYIASIIVTVITYLVAFTRIMEMGVRGAFMPIALGLMADDGWKGPAGRYIKKFLAVCSQGAVLALLGTLSSKVMLVCADNVMTPGTGPSSLGSFIVILGIGFATCTLMFKSIGIINDVFGA